MDPDDLAALLQMASSGDTEETNGAQDALSEAMEALMMLGYDKSTVLSVCKGIDPQISDSAEIIRMALKKLAR